MHPAELEDEKVGVKEKSERGFCCKFCCCLVLLSFFGGVAYIII